MYSKSSVVIYSDASNVAAGAYTVQVESKLFHKMWFVNERAESSTWRELKAIDLALSCFKNSFQCKTIKWFTDSQNCVNIVNAGSMKENYILQPCLFFRHVLKRVFQLIYSGFTKQKTKKLTILARCLISKIGEQLFTFLFLWIKCGTIHGRSFC